MIIEHTDVISAPIDRVYLLVRDQLCDIAEYLPNIDNIKQVSCKQDGAQVTQIVNHWQARAEIPKILNSFIKKELFSWEDRACWQNNQKSVEYELSSFYANDLYHAKGFNQFKSISSKETELILKCEFEIYPEKIPGIPRLLVRKVKPMLNSLITKMLEPNIKSLAIGINSYIKDNPKV